MLTTVRTKLIISGAEEREILRKLMIRDMKVIKRILGIMRYEQGRGKLFSRTKGKWRVSRKDLADLLLATEHRPVVRYNLKSEFVNISHNELMECIDVAREMFLAHLELRKLQHRTGYPRVSEPLTRRIGYRRFRMDIQDSLLFVIDSRRSNYRLVHTSATRVRHDYLRLGFHGYPRLKNHLNQGVPKSLVIVRKEGDYYANITVEIENGVWRDERPKPLGVVGIDLGISKTMVVVLYTRRGIAERRVFNDKQSKWSYNVVEEKIADMTALLQQRSTSGYISNFKHFRDRIQDHTVHGTISQLLDKIHRGEDWSTACHQLELLLTNQQLTSYEQRLQERLIQFRQHSDKSTGNILRRLRRLKHRRQRIKDNMIKQLSSQVKQYVEEKRRDYQLHVVLGDISGIRQRAAPARLRKKIGFWAYHRVSSQLRHSMTKLGMEHRFLQVREAWTSILCYRCNERGTRSRQSLFECANPRCDLIRINADVNGAANIAKRGILASMLVSYSDMSSWNIPEKAIRQSKK